MDKARPKSLHAVKVTVAIPAYNGERFLGEALESVIAQTVPCDECIVVDDGSTDRTRQIATSFSFVRYIRQENGGDANARNTAIDEAQGNVIAFLDADDVWLPRKLEKQLRLLSEQPEIAMVYTGVQIVNPALEGSETLRPAPSHVALRNTLLVEKPYMTGVGSSGVVRTEVAREIRFDERLSASADWAFACNVALRYPVMPVDEPLILYRQHAASQVHRNLDAVERDMTLVWSEIFDHPDLAPELKHLRRRALANLSLSLAASYFKEGDRATFLRYLGRALRLRPDRVTAALWRRYMVPPT